MSYRSFDDFYCYRCQGIQQLARDDNIKHKFDSEVLKGISLPDPVLSNGAWEESKEFVLGLIQDRGYLTLFDYDYEK